MTESRQFGDVSTVWRIALATFWRRRISLVAFALAAGFFHWLVAASFPAIGGTAAVESVVQTFPTELRTLLRIAPNLQAGFGLRDYLAFSWFHPVFLGLGAAFVVVRATDALAGDVESGAVYLLLSRPVPRWTLVTGRMVELVCGAGVIALMAWLGLVLGIVTTLREPLPLAHFLLVAGMAWLLFCALGAGALCISSAARGRGFSSGWGSAWTLLAFVLDVLPFIANSPLGWLNPWHHYFPQEIVAPGRVSGSGVLVLLGWILLGTLVAVHIFGRRDLG